MGLGITGSDCQCVVDLGGFQELDFWRLRNSSYAYRYAIALLHRPSSLGDGTTPE